MTAIEHPPVQRLDLRGTAVATPPAGLRVSGPDDADLHLLRLALDLQVDGMLLALGAAARDAYEGVPWQRWLAEDLELARTLTSTLLIADVEPMPAAGGVSCGAADNALDNLVARYEQMDELLSSVLRRPHTGQAWRPAAAEALARCRTRLEELHLHRVAALRRAAERSPGHATADHRTRSFLPGELLG